MFSAEKLPLEEAQCRQEKCRERLAQLHPEASGMLVFSRTNIYYLTGTRANGILWLPRQGEPVLMVRKGEERCRLESPLRHIFPFKSYSKIPELCAQCGVPLHTETSGTVGAEMRALPWSLATMLEERLQDIHFVNAGAALDFARATKTPYEQERLRHSAQQHHKALTELLPAQIHAGMTEQGIAHTLWKIFFSLGHGGMLRQDRYNEDIFLGNIAAGKNSLYPNAFRSPIGSLGEHAAMPYMGYAGSVWQKGHSLMVDTGFTFEGYHSNIAYTYFAGNKEDIPQHIQQAHACCLHILKHCAALLTPKASLAYIWHEAQTLAQQAGFAETFMGIGAQHVPILGHSVGLSMEEWPAIQHEDTLCQHGQIFALAPMIAVPNIGMVGIKTLFAVTENGGQGLTSYPREIICIANA